MVSKGDTTITNEEEANIVLDEFGALFLIWHAFHFFSEELEIPQKSYVNIVKSSFKHTRKDIQELESAINKEDYEKMEYFSHRIKGVYANLRLNDLSNSAKEIEDNVKSKKSSEDMMANLIKLKDNFNQTKEIFS